MGGGKHRFSEEQDHVEAVVKALEPESKKDIDRDIIRKTQEKLRVLQIRAPAFLGKPDGPKVRAAILLDHVMRTEKEIRLTQQSLLDACGIRSQRANFAKLSETIGNYLLDPNPNPAGNTSKSTQQQQQPTQSGTSQSLLRSDATATRTATATAADDNDSNIIPRLAIRLSSLIHDPHGFATQAEKLLCDIQRFALTLEMSRQVDQLRDMQRVYACYGAACLFHVVARTQSKRLTRKQQQQQQRKQPNNTKGPVTGGTNQHEEDQNRPLEVDDILKACPSFSERDFKQVCKYVDTIVKDMEHAKADLKAKGKVPTIDKAQGAAKKSVATRGKRGASTTNTALTSQPYKKPKTASETTEELANNDLNHEDGHGDKQNNRDSEPSMDIPSLWEWREQVLTESCEAARMAFESRGVETETMTKSDLLAAAADEVLRRFGLLDALPANK